jgi:uncharacterized membrane protein
VQSGYLTKEDWLIFNGKENALTLDPPIYRGSGATLAHLMLKNDAGSAITEIDTAASVENSATKIPASSQVYSALSGKSDTTHNHNLADLTEHSYSSLTDKPTIPTIEDTPTDGHTTIGASSNSVYDHIANTSNPHSVTKAQVGLTNVIDTAQLPASYLETTWTDSDVKVSSSKAMGTKAAALISSHAGVNNAHHNPVSIGTANGLSLSTQALSMAASSTSVVGAVQLEDSHTSTSTSKAACPKNVKEAYDLANAALPSANLESSPTNGQTGKAPNSDWAYKIESEACTLSGVKTFGSFPVTPSSAPTANYEVANKKYVDDNAGGGISEVSEDFTPQLGGDLDQNGHNINITDAGSLITATTLDAALQELASKEKFIPFDDDKNAWDLTLHASTNGAYVEIDFVHGDLENATNMATATTEITTSPSHVVPAGTTKILLHGILAASSANTSNRINIFKKGNSNVYMSTFCYPPPTANYYTPIPAILTLDSNSKAKFLFSLGAGQIYSYWAIKGYWGI